jgi:hypothetical protein
LRRLNSQAHLRLPPQILQSPLTLEALQLVPHHFFILGHQSHKLLAHLLLLGAENEEEACLRPHVLFLGRLLKLQTVVRVLLQLFVLFTLLRLLLSHHR